MDVESIFDLSAIRDFLFPPDMKNAIASYLTVRQYLVKCQTSTSELRACMDSNHWIEYMRDKSLDDWYLVLQFASQYIIEHPKLWVGLTDSFLVVFDTEIKSVRIRTRTLGVHTTRTLFIHRIMPFVGVNRVLTPDESTFYDIARLAQKTSEKVVSLEFNENIYGAIEDLESSNMAKLYMKVMSFYDALVRNGIMKNQTTENPTFRFFKDFIESAQIKDRVLDSKIVDYILPRIYELYPSGPRQKDPDIYQDIYVAKRYHNYILRIARGNLSIESQMMEPYLLKLREEQREEYTAILLG